MAGSPNTLGPDKAVEMPMAPCIVFRDDRPVLVNILDSG